MNPSQLIVGKLYYYKWTNEIMVFVKKVKGHPATKKRNSYYFYNLTSNFYDEEFFYSNGVQAAIRNKPTKNIKRYLKNI